MTGKPKPNHTTVPAKARRTRPWRRAMLMVGITVASGFAVNITSAYLLPALAPYWIWAWVGLVVITVVAIIIAAKDQPSDSPSAPAIDNSTTITGNKGPTMVGTTINAPVAGRDVVNIIQNPAPAPTRHGSAPPPPSLVIGREDAIKELKRRLGIGKWEKPSDTTQVLTAVHGWPGVGKTTLASALAHDPAVAEAFPDGILWASLGTTPNILSELAKWGRALGVDNLNQVQDTPEATAILAGLLRDKRMLLIIDDAWTAADAQPFKVGGAACATLVTTRQPDTARDIAPNPKAVYNLDVLTEKNAIKLLTQLAPTVVSNHPKDSLALVNELGRLPLAIQVAGRLLQAKASRNSGVAQLLKDLRTGTTLLESKAPADRTDTVTGTTPTVAVLLETSVKDLDVATQGHFKSLAPFAPKPASFDSAALAAVCQAEDPHPAIDALIDRGLIEPALNEGRYQIHAIMRKFAGHIAGNSNAGLMHAAYYEELASSADDLYYHGGEDILPGLALFDLERDNIETGQQWAAANSNTDDHAAELCIAYPLRCPYIVSLRLHPREQIQWLEAALQAARRLGKQRSEANALGNIGTLYELLGDYQRAIEFCTKQLEIAREIGDRHGEGYALGNLGNAYFSLHEHDRAIELYKHSLQVANDIPDPRMAANALGNLGNIYNTLRDFPRAIKFYEQSREISLEIGDPQGEQSALGNLGIAYGSLGEFRRAIGFYEQSYQIARKIGDHRGEGTSLFNWSVTLDALGERENAIALAQQALGALEDGGAPLAQQVREKLAEWQRQGA